MSAALFLAAALLAADDAADRIAEVRSAGDVAQRYRAAAALAGAVRPTHVPLLVREIDAGPADLRPFFIRALARIRDDRSKEALQGLCRRHEVASRAEAAYALRLYGDDPVARQVLPALLEEASGDEEKMAVLNKFFGGHGSCPEYTRALTKFIGKEGTQHLRRQAIYMLGTHKGPEAAEALRKVADDEKDELRHDALAQLIRTGDAAALERGLAALEEGRVGPIAVHQLVNAIQILNNRDALPRLRTALEKAADPSVKIAIMRTLAAMKDEKAVPLFRKLEEDENPSVSKAASSALIQVEGRAGVDLVRKATGGDDPDLQVEAAEKLLHLDKPEGFKAIRAVLESGSPFRHRAVSILSGVHRAESVDILVGLLEDKDAQVASSARQAVIAVLSSLYPYLKFAPGAPASTIRDWWSKNRPK